MNIANSFVNQIPRRIMSYYAVAIGREIGIYDTWSKCEEKIKGYRGARYKKFPSLEDAKSFIYEHHKHRLSWEDIAKYAEKYEDPMKKVAPVAAPITMPVEDFWPPSDGDTYDENQISDHDLLMALAEVEGLPEPMRAPKRKMESIASSSTSKIPKYESTDCQSTGLKHIGNFEFHIDAEGYVIAYTDGSCFNNGQANACAGYGVYFGDEHPLNIGKPVEGRVTNNVGEIQASIYAIKTAKLLGIKKIVICTDSQFLINSVTLWMKGWKAKNWKLRNGDPVKNVDDFKQLDELLSGKEVDVKWNYVAAHNGIKGNEMADSLARQGSEIYKRLHWNK
ncbi:ribonuclease H1 [Stomoxys calcitrans]|uniref:Ribonuclease H1 n=1 Tax=Stomoxys calcitrans TaxID=35570 RepID=A0A1I8Q8C3_STOCA|nr:ribonuclease H1 [Stomoxys calcitrans]